MKPRYTYSDAIALMGRKSESASPALPEPKPACKFGDPLCPCQDGDACHYEGANPMTPPTVLAPDTRPPITTGALNAYFGEGYGVTAQAIKALGFRQVAAPIGKGAGTYWAAADRPLLWMAQARHFGSLA